MKLIIAIFIFSQLLLQPIYSQEVALKIVYDSISKAPLSYAHVYNSVQINEGTITNLEGHFLLPNIDNERDSISISSIGYPLTKVCYKDLMDIDTVFIGRKAQKLNEVILYDHVSILDKVKNNLVQNYPSEPIQEQYFVRSFVKQNEAKFQIIETLLDLKKQYYFGKNKGRDIEINIIANNNVKNEKIEKVKKIEYSLYSYNDLFSFADYLFNMNDSYHYSAEDISHDKIRISFAKKNPSTSNIGSFKGYLIINKTDFAIIEFFYEKDFNEGEIVKNLKEDFNLEHLHKSGHRIWKKDKNENKYKLELMIIQNSVLLSNTKYNIKDNYNANYTIQKINQKITTQSKQKKVKREKKSISSYKNLKIEEFKKIQYNIILKTKEQQ